MNTPKDFFTELFDLSFKSFITPKIIKLLYIIAIIASSIEGLIMLVNGVNLMNELPFYGFLFVILAFLIPLLGIIFSRVILETIIVFFNIEKNTVEIAKNKEKEANVEGSGLV